MPVELGTKSDTTYLIIKYLQVMVRIKDIGTLSLDFREDQTSPQKGEGAYQLQTLCIRNLIAT